MDERHSRHSHAAFYKQLHMDLITTWQHLFSAVLTLGSNQGTVDERLRQAYIGGLSRISPNPGLPDHIQEEYDKLMSELTDLYKHQGSIDTKRASLLAKRVVAIYDRVTKELQ